MKQGRLFFLLALLLVLLLITACGGMESADAESIGGPESEAHADTTAQTDTAEHNDEDEHEDDEENDMAHGHVAAPDEFASLTNPFVDEHEALAAGEETYNTLCVTCHGTAGQGDGPGAEGLDPKPASLADGAMMSELSDGYLFWRVSKGGQMAPFNSAMPAWENGLTEEQRWQVITYIRSLSGEADEHAEDDGHSEEETEEAHSD